MALVGTSLNAAASTGPGTAIEFDVPRQVLMQVYCTGTSGGTNCEVDIEGSLDGAHWFYMGAVLFNNPNSSNAVNAALTSSLPAFAPYARANLVTLGSNITSVTAIIASI